MRTGQVSRKTKETEIDVTVDLDGRGDASVTTGQTVLRARNAQAVNLSAELVSSFDTKQSDPLSTWSDQRSQQRIARERRMQEARAMVRARRRLQMEENSQ